VANIAKANSNQLTYATGYLMSRIGIRGRNGGYGSPVGFLVFCSFLGSISF